MAYTATQLAAVEAAIATGATRVEVDGLVVQYQRLNDLIALRDRMQAELDIATATTARGRAWKPSSSPGL